MNATGVLLAAGASRRMGSHKALLRTAGMSFAAHGVELLWSGCDSAVVVLGAHAARIRAAIEADLERRATKHASRPAAGRARLEARLVMNRAWARGMFGSVRLGLRAALSFEPDAVLVLPVDHPAVKPNTVRALVETMGDALGAFGERRAAAGFAYALVPRHRRRRGHPLALSAALARAIVADSGATDLSDAVRRNTRLVGFLDCTDPGILYNLNTPAGRSKGIRHG
jgi:CTP:molybdopterin cytidylyltransferase MocA